MASTTSVHTLDYRPAAEEEGQLSVKSLAVRGSIWAIVGFGAGVIIRLGTNLIITRPWFLKPEAFGLMGLVLAMVQGITMCSDLGLGAAIVQHKRGDEARFLNTAWTLSVLRGTGVWLLCCIIAWPVAQYYHLPVLLLPVAGLAALIGGFNATSLYTLNRRLQLAKITLLNLSAQLLSTVAIIAMAWKLHSVWALVAGLLVSNLVTMVASHFLSSGKRNRFAWDPQAVRELFHFGRWVFVSTMLTFLSMRADRLMLGRLVFKDVLGIYVIAQTLVQMPIDFMGQLAAQTLYPLLAHSHREQPRELAPIVLRSRSLILPAALAMTIGVVLGARRFFLMYPVEYRDATWMAQLLALGGWFTLLQMTADRALLAVGNIRALAVGNGVNMWVTLAAGVTGFHWYGVEGLIIGVGLGNLAGYVVVVMYMSSMGIELVMQDLRYTAMLAAVLVGSLPLLRHTQLHLAYAATAVLVTCVWAAVKVRRWAAEGRA